MRGVVVLGATGSVGTQAAEVLAAYPDRFRVLGLSARRNGTALLALARRLKAPVVALVDEDAAEEASRAAKPGDPEVRAGEDGLLSLLSLPGVDAVLQATSGAAGLKASLIAVEKGLRLALANKESMVVAGPLLLAAARASGAEIVPVDSEHAAIHQCLRAGRKEEVRRLVLTASGGPFLRASADRLAHVTPAEALKHPTWDMGKRITVDSATLMNKALEVVEARWLFDVPPERIEVVVHPQSVVHSMVEFTDGSVVAQMGPPDMRTPIRYALSYPDRLPSPTPSFDVADYASLSFEAPDRARFPALSLGWRAARLGGTAGAALNAADEVAVERFLAGDLAFDRIAPLCESALSSHPFSAAPSLDALLSVDRWARTEALSRCRP